MDKHNTADKVGLPVTASNLQNVIEQLGALRFHPVVVSLVDRDYELRFGLAKEGVENFVGGFHN